MHYSTEKVFKDYTSGIKTLGFHSIKNRRYLILQDVWRQLFTFYRFMF